MNRDDILEILAPFIPKYKKYWDDMKKANRTHSGEEIYGDFHPTYNICAEMMDRIRVHADHGIFPHKLFAKRSPNQTEEEYQYIKDNYKQVTAPVFQDFLNQINRIFQDTNFSIHYKEQPAEFADQTFEEYVNSEIKKYTSVENFVKFFLPNLKLIDANGVLVVRPDNINVNIEENENGEKVRNIEVGDNDNLLEPIPKYFSCKQIVNEEEGEHIMVLTHDKSKVLYNNKWMEIGLVLEVYTRDSIWRVEQVGKFVDFEFDIYELFVHDGDIEPYEKLKGIPKLIDEEVVYQSPFLFATDLLDMVLLNSSNLQVSINMCVYPYRVQIGDECDFTDTMGNSCDDGTIYKADQTSYTCPKCNGSGLRSRISPTGVMLLRPKQRGEEADETSMTQAPIQYIAPTVEPLEFLRSKNHEDEQKARRILHLTTSESKVKGSGDMTATEMALDLKALYAFLKPISDQIFGLWEYIDQAIGVLRYGASFEAPTFVYPQNFDFMTESDYLAQIQEMITAGLPPSLIQAVLHKYINRLFYNNPKMNQVFKLAIEADRLFNLSEDALSIKLNNGTVEPWEDVLHTSAIYIIKDLIEKNEDFLERSLEDQITAIEEEAKAKVGTVTPPPTE